MSSTWEERSTLLKDLTRKYALSRERLGSGGFGTVVRGTHLATEIEGLQ